MGKNGAISADAKLDCRPWKLELRSSKNFVIWVISIAVFTDIFIYGMIVPILPVVLKTRVDVPEDQLQTWMSILLAAFGGATLVGAPIFGYYADRATSRQSPFIVGLLALAGSTAMFWLATSLVALVLARVLQGLSAAVVWTVGMAVVVDTVGQEQVGAAMGIVSMAMTMGTVAGPFFGGLVLARAGYHAVFSMAIALIALDIVLRLVMIEQKTAAKWIERKPNEETEGLLRDSATGNHADYASTSQNHAEQGLTGSGAVVYASSTEQQENGNVEVTSRRRTAALPAIVRLMCSGHLLIVLGATIVDAVLYTSFDTVLPLYVMRTFQWGPLEIGLCFIPLFAPSFFSPAIGHAVDRFGARTLAFLGFVLDLPVFLLLQFVTTNTTTDKVLLCVLLFFAGIASVLQMVSLMVEVSRVVEQKEKECPGIFGQQGGTAQGYGLFNVAWSTGQVVGPLLAGLLIDQAGWGVMVSTFGVMSVGVAVLLACTDEKILRTIWGRMET